MNIITQTNNFESFIIFGDEFDPITCFLQEFGNTKGELTIICWGRAWSCYWSNMGMDIRSFILKASAEYIANKMIQREIITNKRTEKREMQYLIGIVGEVKKAIVQRLTS